MVTEKVRTEEFITSKSALKKNVRVSCSGKMKIIWGGNSNPENITKNAKMENIKGFLKQLKNLNIIEAKVEAKVFCKYIQVKRPKKQCTKWEDEMTEGLYITSEEK